MEFKSKTALVEHIKELVRDGFLVEYKTYLSDDRSTHVETIYKLNTLAVKKEDDEGHLPWTDPSRHI